MKRGRWLWFIVHFDLAPGLVAVIAMLVASLLLQFSR